MSKIISNEDELNTSQEDLITKNYALELLGLKNPVDLRRFSKSFIKLDDIIKKIEENKMEKKVGAYLTISEDGTLNVLVTTPEVLTALVEKYKGAGA